MPGPITPKEVDARKKAAIPEAVFEVFNFLIAESWDGHQAAVLQNNAAERIAKDLGISRSEVFSRHLLDIEETYRSAGWDVEYDKPGYNEAGEPVFKFRKGKK